MSSNCIKEKAGFQGEIDKSITVKRDFYILHLVTYRSSRWKLESKCKIRTT